MISIEINYEPSIKGQLTNQPFNEASYCGRNASLFTHKVSRLCQV